MRLATLFGPDFHATLAEDPNAFREALAEFHEEDIAEIVADLPLEDVVALLRVLPDDFGAGVLERLTDEARTQILEKLKVEEAATLLAEMAPDDRADAVQELELPLQAMLLAELDKTEPEAADEVRELARYPEGSVGSIMTPAFVGLAPETKIWKAIDELRRLSREGAAEIIYYVYGVAYSDKLVGVVSLRDLILADPSQELSDVMTENVVRILDSDDREEAARAIAKYDFHALRLLTRMGACLAS